MGLSIRALSMGRLVGLHKPTITCMRGWGSTFDSSLIMFMIDGGDAPVIVADHIPSGLYTNLIEYDESFRKIESLDCRVIPSHDEAVLKQGLFE